jgi:hypothetical protein
MTEFGQNVKNLTVATVMVAVAGFSAQAEPAGTNAPAAAAPAEILPVVGVKEFLTNPAALSGKQIVIEGFVVDVCRNKGCWALLHDTNADDKSQVRVKQDDDSPTFKAFLPELQGRTLSVTATVRETHIDKDYLDQWEARVKKQQEKAAEKSAATNSVADASANFDKILKQIAAYRERVAKSEKGYISSFLLDVAKWEAKPEKS